MNPALNRMFVAITAGTNEPAKSMAIIPASAAPVKV
jgi:hypothetical protein